MGIKVGNVIQAKVGTVARTNTSAKTLFVLPADAMIVGIRMFGTASDAGTSATVTLKNVPFDTGTAATFATADAKTTTGAVTTGSLSGIAYSRVGIAQQITATYVEDGTASTAGGDWTIVVEYL